MGKSTKSVGSPSDAASQVARRSADQAERLGMHLWVDEARNQGFFCLCRIGHEHTDEPVFR